MDTIGASVAAMTAAKLSLTPPPAVAALAHAAAPHAPTTASHRPHSAVLCYPNLSAVCAAEEAARPTQPRARLQGSSSSPSTVGGYVRYLSAKWQPTNYNMLLFRTLNRDLCLPNANADHIAPLFRDRLMPVRSWANRSFPALLAVTRRGVEDPQSGCPGVCNFVDARTKWIDGALQQALDGGITQVVCIAAGFDSRAYRFHRQGVQFFEVDLPVASKRKQHLVSAVLPPPRVLPRPTYIAADLSRTTLDAALAASSSTGTSADAAAEGFDPTRPTFFTCEGLIYYLPTAAVSALLASVAAVAAPGSRLAFDFLHDDAQDGRAAYPGYDACAESVALKGEAFLSGLPAAGERVGAYLAPLGWRLDRVWSPRQMLAAQLPHERWSDELPPILSFYSYCEVEVEVAGGADVAPAGANKATEGGGERLQRSGSLIPAGAPAGGDS